MGDCNSLNALFSTDSVLTILPSVYEIRVTTATKFFSWTNKNEPFGERLVIKELHSLLCVLLFYEYNYQRSFVCRDNCRLCLLSRAIVADKAGVQPRP